jgi:hypothetical protein
LWSKRRFRNIELKCHDIDTSLLEGVFCRGDRRLGAAIELAWQRGARFDSWSDRFQPRLWWQALEESGIDVEATLHRPYPLDAELPWDHVGIHQGRAYLEKEQANSQSQLNKGAPA